MITKQNILFVIFSFNRTHELVTLLDSIRTNTPGFDILLIDDASTLSATHRIIDTYQNLFKHVIKQPPVAKDSSRGRLPQNIKYAYEFAAENDYKYVFFIQDDMQFVRPLNEKILMEYSDLFKADQQVIQVDPRFLRRLGDIVIRSDMHAYSFPCTDDRSSFADVGITHIDRLKTMNWTFEGSERKNKEKAHALGLKRIFPFTPVFMHVPYPVIYRKGRKKMKFPSPLLMRGKVAYAYMDTDETEKTDTRNLETIPYARDLLRVKGLGLAGWHYRNSSENKIFC